MLEVTLRGAKQTATIVRARLQPYVELHETIRRTTIKHEPTNPVMFPL
jgi:hypothetical protein